MSGSSASYNVSHVFRSLPTSCVLPKSRVLPNVRSPIEVHQGAIDRLCQRFGVRRLEVFGSALRSDFGPQSDIDLLVEFGRPSGLDAFEQYFGFKEAVERLVSREIDLIVADAVRNQAFRAELDRTKAALYVAA